MSLLKHLNKKNISKAITILSFPFLMNSCSSEEPKDTSSSSTSTTPSTATIYSDNVKLIDSNIGRNITSFKNNIITFSSMPQSFKQSLSKDTILKYDGNANVPTGFLGKVRTVDRNLILITPTSLEEAIKQGIFKINKTLQNKNISYVKFAEGVRYYASNSNMDISFNLDKCFEDKFCIEGNISFDASFNLDGKISYNKTKSLKFGLDLEKYLELKVISLQTSNIEKSFNLVKYCFAPIVSPPIVVVPCFNVDLEINAALSSGLEFDILKRESSKTELSYENNRWGLQKTKEIELDNLETPNVPIVDSQVQVSLNPKLEILIYGVAGPNVKFKAFANFSSNVNSNPWWKLNAGASISIGINAGVFGAGIKYDAQIASLEKELLVADSKVPLKFNLDVSPTSGKAPLEILFDASDSYSEFGIKSFEVDCNEENTTLSVPNGWLQKSCNYETFGDFLAKATLTDTKGNTSLKETSIIVEKPAWNGTSPLVDPRDDKEYNIIKIGDRLWMAENLNYETPSSVCYDNDSSMCNEYGSLYSSSEARSICPSGWSLPSMNDWKLAATSLGFSPGTYGKVKSTAEKISEFFEGGTTGLDIQTGGAYIGNWDNYVGEGSSGRYWLSTKGEFGGNIHLSFVKDSDKVSAIEGFSNDFHSVRCSKNN